MTNDETSRNNECRKSSHRTLLRWATFQFAFGLRHCLVIGYFVIRHWLTSVGRLSDAVQVVYEKRRLPSTVVPCSHPDRNALQCTMSHAAHESTGECRPETCSAVRRVTPVKQKSVDFVRTKACWCRKPYVAGLELAGSYQAAK